MKVSVTCDNCGLIFMRERAEVARGSKRSFCSIPCFGQSRIPGSKEATAERFDKLWMPEPNSGCYLWLGSIQKCTENYWQGRFDRKLASRVAWELVNGDIPSGMCVLHRCDNPLCVRVDHLFLGTRKDNTRDMWRKGRAVKSAAMARGEAHPRAVLTDELVRSIRASEGPPIATSRKLKISRRLVYNILKNQTWRHVS